MSHFLRLAQFALLVAFASPAFAGSLWQETRSGMTVEEIRQLYPQAQPVEENIAVAPPRAKIALPRIEVAGRPFRVSFLFARDRLDSVVLALTDAAADLSDIGIVDEVSLALRSKYGREISASTNRVAGMVGIERTWVQGTLAVKLSFIGAQGLPSIFTILYSEDVARNAGKL